MDIPNFLLQEKLPLLIASSSNYRQHSKSAILTKYGYLALTEQRQLVYWPDRQNGALEISSLFPEAYAETYYFGCTGNYCYISFQERQTRQLKLYQFSTDTFELSEKAVEIKVNDWRDRIHYNLYHQKDGKFLFGNFYQWSLHSVSLNGYTGLVIAEERDYWNTLQEETKENEKKERLDYHQYRKVFPKPLTIISTLRSIKINEKGNLVINGKHELIFAPDHVEFVLIKEPVEARDIVLTARKLKLKNLLSPLIRYHWPDGSELWFDKARQMLYLRSSDKTLPEMAIPLVILSHTACWASDGVICGNPYFRPKDLKGTEVMDFHEKYFRPFINVIQQYPLVQQDEPAQYKPPVDSRETPGVKEVPKFLLQEKRPLLITSSSTYHRRMFFGKLTSEGYLGLTERQQLLYWADRKNGALEISALFPEAHRNKYYFGWTGNAIYIFFKEKSTSQLKLYQFSEETFELMEKTVDMQLKEWPDRNRGSYYHQKTGKFLFEDYPVVNTKLTSLDTHNGLLVAEEKDYWHTLAGEVREENRRMAVYTPAMYKMLEAPLPIISTFRSIKINEKGNLVINDRHELTFATDHVEFVLKREPVDAYDTISTAEKLKLKNHLSPLVCYNWPDGSELWFDKARHMLYLRSSDKTLPEMAIPLVIRSHTACWASDGAICGSTYFRPKNVEVISIMDFHEKYFRPFINVIQQYATAAAT